MESMCSGGQSYSVQCSAHDVNDFGDKSVVCLEKEDCEPCVLYVLNSKANKEVSSGLCSHSNINADVVVQIDVWYSLFFPTGFTV